MVGANRITEFMPKQIVIEVPDWIERCDSLRDND